MGGRGGGVQHMKRLRERRSDKFKTMVARERCQTFAGGMGEESDSLFLI